MTAFAYVITRLYRAFVKARSQQAENEIRRHMHW